MGQGPTVHGTYGVIHYTGPYRALQGLEASILVYGALQGLEASLLVYWALQCPIPYYAGQALQGPIPYYAGQALQGPIYCRPGPTGPYILPARPYRASTGPLLQALQGQYWPSSPGPTGPVLASRPVSER